MLKRKTLGFVTHNETKVEWLPWGPHEWLARKDIVDTEQLLMARVRVRSGQGHGFHRHPAMEELIYVLEGEAEQWIGEERRVLRPGEAAHIPRNVVHATFCLGSTPLRYLLVLGPAEFKGLAIEDVSGEEPWASIRENSTAANRKSCDKTSGGQRARTKQLSRAISSKRAASKRAASNGSKGDVGKGAANKATKPVASSKKTSGSTGSKKTVRRAKSGDSKTPKTKRVKKTPGRQ